MRPGADLFPFCYFLNEAMSTKRTMPGGWVDPNILPKGSNGRNLCRWCSLEVPKGRVTFCSAWCVEEWRLRSDPGYIREKVLERDRGVCASCGIDCLHAERQLKRLRGAARLKVLLDWGLQGSRASSRKTCGMPIISFRWWRAAANAISKTFAPCASSAIARLLPNCESVAS